MAKLKINGELVDVDVDHSTPLQGFEIVDEPADADCIIFVENHPGNADTARICQTF